MKIERHPDPAIDRKIDDYAERFVADMTPCEMGEMLYPGAAPRKLDDVPEQIVLEHLTRYTRDDLKKGQFLEVLPGKYTFIMAKEPRRRLEGRSKKRKGRRRKLEGRR